MRYASSQSRARSQGLGPARPPRRALVGAHARLEPAIDLPRLGELRGRFPEADRQAGQERGAEGGGLDDLGPDDRHAEDVGLELHQQVVGRGAAVHAQLAEGDARVCLHHVEHVGDLEGDALERGAREVRLVVPRVMPAIRPRAYWSQCGAPRPAKAGTR